RLVHALAKPRQWGRCPCHHADWRHGGAAAIRGNDYHGQRVGRWDHDVRWRYGNDVGVGFGNERIDAGLSIHATFGSAEQPEILGRWRTNELGPRRSHRRNIHKQPRQRLQYSVEYFQRSSGEGTDRRSGNVTDCGKWPMIARLGQVLYWLGCAVAALIAALAAVLYWTEAYARSDGVWVTAAFLIIAGNSVGYRASSYRHLATQGQWKSEPIDRLTPSAFPSPRLILAGLAPSIG